MSKFVHLHTHSHYSLLEDLPKIPDLVKKAVLSDMKSLALTDSGSLYGAIEFYKECKEQGIKPIIGVDFYVAARTRHDKKPRIDSELLEKYNEGLIAIAKDKKYYKEIFKDRFYLENQLAIYNIHYINPEDRPAFNTVLSIQEQLSRGAFDEEEDLSFRIPEQVKEDFPPEAIENTVKIAERCNVELELGKWVFPNYVTESGRSYDEELRAIVYAGLEKKKLDKTDEIVERIEYE